MNSSKNQGDQPMLRILGISKQGNFSATSARVKTINGQSVHSARPMYPMIGGNREMTVTVTRYMSERTRYWTLSNLVGNNVFMMSIRVVLPA